MTVVLRPYQEEGITLIHDKHNGRALLGDSPGLGKTVQALTYMKRHVPPGHVVVLCPASVKYHWEKEAKDHVGMRAEVLEGMTPPDRVPPSKPKIWVLSYNILGVSETGNTWLRFLRSLKPVLVVMDESQLVKDSSTKRFKGVRKLVKGVPRLLALSGTPIENHAGEIWTTAHLLRPDVEYFSNWPRFARRFTNPVRKPWGWVFKGSKNVQELNVLLHQHILIRRKKEDVLKDLPACVKAVVPFKLSPKDMAQYREAEADIIAWLAKTHGKRTADKARKAEQMVKLGYLKRLAAKLRLEQSYRWTLDQLETTEQKIVLFGVGRRLLLDLEGRFNGRSVLVNGSVSPRDRPGLISRFRNDSKVRVFLGNIRAAGVGMDGLQYACSQMAFLELDFNPAAILQCIGRLDRLGQRFSTLCSMHTTLGTVDELLLEIIQKKSRMSQEIIDGKVTDGMDVHDLLEKKLLERSKT